MRALKNISWMIMFLFVWSIVGITWFEGKFTPLYRVKDYYGVVLTEFGGHKSVDETPGLGCKLRFTTIITNVEEHSLRAEDIYLDNNPEPHYMQAKDDMNFLGAGVWMIKVVDLQTWGIKMGSNAMAKLMKNLDGVAKNVIQSNEVETIMSGLGAINQAVFDSPEKIKLEKEFGVEIISFRMTYANYPESLNEKMAEAKGIRIKGEAVEAAAGNLAEARKKLGLADQDRLGNLVTGSGVTTEAGRLKALDTLQQLGMQDMLGQRPPGENTIIFAPAGGNTPNLTIPSPPQKPAVRR